MRKMFIAIFALFSSAGIANAANFGHATDLDSAMGWQMQPFNGLAPAGVCDPGTPNLVVHDDGEAENGYGWNPSAGTDGRYADMFTPNTYPATIDTVCMSFITNAGVTSFNFNVAVYAADGADGAPGTLLGSKAVVGHPVSLGGLPFTPTFEAFDISDLALVIPSGSVYISANWDATVGTTGVYLGVDESASTPMAGGYNYSETELWRALGVANQPNYRALMIRAVMPSEDSTTDPNLVCSGPINHPIVNNIDGTSINWSTGAIVDAGPSSGYDFNPYATGGKLGFYWAQSLVGAGVAEAATGTGWKVLQLGDQIGPSSVFSRGTGPAADWDSGVDGYLGFKFDCSSIPDAPTSGVCYGYARMTTTGPDGFPATLVNYCYNKAGNMITIGDRIFYSGFELGEDGS